MHTEPDLSINALVERSYAIASSKGWHAEPMRERVPGLPAGVFPVEQAIANGANVHIGEPFRYHHDRILAKIALMHSELGEAWEAYELRDFKLWYATGSEKPEGFVVEIADVLIRIFDTCGALGLNLGYAVDQQKHAPDWLAEVPAEDMRVDAYLTRSLMRARCLLDAATECVRVDDWATCTQRFAGVVLRLTAVCNGLGLDLAAALDAKARYNQSRPHRHGGKRA